LGVLVKGSQDGGISPIEVPTPFNGHQEIFARNDVTEREGSVAVALVHAHIVVKIFSELRLQENEFVSHRVVYRIHEVRKLVVVCAVGPRKEGDVVDIYRNSRLRRRRENWQSRRGMQTSEAGVAAASAKRLTLAQRRRILRKSAARSWVEVRKAGLSGGSMLKQLIGRVREVFLAIRERIADGELFYQVRYSSAPLWKPWRDY
jgi:hypothetical protein